MTWLSVICLLVLSSAAFSNASYGSYTSRMFTKPRIAMIAPLATQTYQAPAIQPLMPTTYGASYGSVSPYRQFDTPVAPSLPLSDADIFCKGKLPESIFPIGDGERYIVCVAEGEGEELSCPQGLIWDNQKSRCERRLKDLKNPCDAQPCLNGGQCFTTEYSYQCKCAPGFDGLTCELDARVCQTQQPCGGFGSICQSFHVNAALQHVCIAQDGRSYGLGAQQSHPNPCLTRDGLFPLAFSNKGYISCNGEIMNIHSCPGGTVWSDLNKVCVWSDMEFSDKQIDISSQQGQGSLNQGVQIELTGQTQQPLQNTYSHSSSSSYGGQTELQRPVELPRHIHFQRTFPKQHRVSSYGSQVEVQRPVERIVPQQQQYSSYGSQVEVQRPVERIAPQQQQYSSYGSQVEVQRPVERIVPQQQQQYSSYGSQAEVQRPVELPRPVERVILQQPQQQYSSYGSQAEVQRPVELPRPVERTFQHQSSSYGSQVASPLPKVNQMLRSSGY